MVDDYVIVALVVSSAFFVALSFGLLYRYRQVSQRMTESSDLGRDLWSSLEQRLKKQDERIIDMMARFEVIQARSVVGPPGPPVSSAPTPVESSVSPPAAAPVGLGTPLSNVTELSPVAQQSESQRLQGESQLKSQLRLDKTHLAAVDSLKSGPLTTIQIRAVLEEKVKVKSREQAARVMKYLFDQGLVSRDDSDKPFTYSLTEEGKRFLS